MPSECVIVQLSNKASAVAGFRYTAILNGQNQPGAAYTFSSLHEMIQHFGHRIDDWSAVENQLRAEKAWKGKIG